MKVKQLIGERLKERPSDCQTESHALMIRGGYMKQVANGIYSQYPPLRRICQKIEKIIREEMDAIGGQEIQFPVVLPASLWEESGRYRSVGEELLRFSDRFGSPLVLGMTHEEAAVHLVREYGQSYARYPFMIYQIQTKFRDEARPRAGLIRVREFAMKDAYSFHTSQEDLEQYYQQCYHAYERIFARVGLPQVITVASDSGMMGGSISHEYMLLTPVGEDSIALCPHCSYRSNLEAAPNLLPSPEQEELQALTPVETPHMESIEQVSNYLHVDAAHTCKAVVYQKRSDSGYVVVFLRGDLTVNETKLTNYLGEELCPAQITEESGLCAGYLGPYGLHAQAQVLFDRSLQGAVNLCCGANRTGFHYTGLCMPRDLPEVEFFDFAKAVEGGICPQCGRHSLTISRGIEVGNIFQLGDKYTRSMGMQYLDENGCLQYPIMGCYGIGIGRLAASICEVYRDEHGPIWPISVAPWQVSLCCLRADDQEVRKAADALYDCLQKQGIEVLYDDREIRAGAMFTDADLFGLPIRVVISPRNLKNGCVELTTRDGTVKREVPIEQAAEEIHALIHQLYGELSSHVR